jgi:hypothetical protein
MMWSRALGGASLAVISALLGCAPAIDDEAMEADEADEGTDPEADDGEGEEGTPAESDIDVAVVGAILVSTQGAENTTEISVLVEVSNLGVTPVTAIQLRSFTFGGYWARSSIFANPSNLEDEMPLAPGETVTLRFGHLESGALFDCAAWEGPVETEVMLHFTVDATVVEAPALANVRCRELD